MDSDHDIPDIDKVKRSAKVGVYIRTWETGICPDGQEFVHGYRTPNGTYVEGFCRKARSLRSRFKGVIQRF
jgi:hypothetical protein